MLITWKFSGISQYLSTHQNLSCIGVRQSYPQKSTHLSTLINTFSTTIGRGRYIGGTLYGRPPRASRGGRIARSTHRPGRPAGSPQGPVGPGGPGSPPGRAGLVNGARDEAHGARHASFERVARRNRARSEPGMASDLSARTTREEEPKRGMGHPAPSREPPTAAADPPRYRAGRIPTAKHRRGGDSGGGQGPRVPGWTESTQKTPAREAASGNKQAHGCAVPGKQSASLRGGPPRLTPKKPRETTSDATQTTLGPRALSEERA